MHSYLRAIGFSKVHNRKEINAILEDVIHHYDEKMVVDEGDGRLVAEMTKLYGYDSGIKVVGEYDENNEFRMDYYFPYFHGTGITTTENVVVEQHTEKESFSGACDDVRIGVTLIFYLENAGEYLNEKYKDVSRKDRITLTLSGLCTEGYVLLPIQKNQRQKEQDYQMNRKRNQMIHEARNGSEEAMENLTMEDMDTYAMISRRISHEDVFSIVDTSFMPYGMECDRYTVLGEIIDLLEGENTLTGEKLYQMTICCNDIEFDICMNQEDLMGEPQIGRRFRGVVWLQGHLNFDI